MKSALRKSLSISGGILSVCSGLLWHISATSQLGATQAANPASDSAMKLVAFSAHVNVWAAICAVLTGLVLSVATYLDD